MKKPRHIKRSLDDIELLPEEIEDDDMVADDEEPIPDDGYEEVTEEITEDDFHRFKESLPSDWEG